MFAVWAIAGLAHKENIEKEVKIIPGSCFLFIFKQNSDIVDYVSGVYAAIILSSYLLGI